MNDYGVIEYFLPDGRNIVLTLVSEEDEDVLLTEGVTALRRLRIKRLIEEARAQGYQLSVRELSEILYVSKSTIIRDIAYLRNKGMLSNIQRLISEASEPEKRSARDLVEKV